MRYMRDGTQRMHFNILDSQSIEKSNKKNTKKEQQGIETQQLHH